MYALHLTKHVIDKYYNYISFKLNFIGLNMIGTTGNILFPLLLIDMLRFEILELLDEEAMQEQKRIYGIENDIFEVRDD